METVAFMVVLAIGSLVVGAVLRLRWTVLSVVPAMLVVTMVIAGIGLAGSYGFWSIIAAVAVSATSLQFGYLVGQSVREAARMLFGGSPPGDRT